MGNKKNIILTVLLLSLSAGIAAAGTNDLLKMDVKKSSSNDAVDVTFYTTGGSTNSVVTRKGDNRYVVLLPNVAGSSSVTPNIGGVKDLIQNIDVKNIDDGIGGYTKVTFTTSKPLKIQTAMKKTAPLTKAQEEYKNLIVQNKNTKPAVLPKANSIVATKQTAVVKQSTNPLKVKIDVKNTTTSKQATTKQIQPVQAVKQVQKSLVAQSAPKKVVKAEQKLAVNNIVKKEAPVQVSTPKADVKNTQQQATNISTTQQAAVKPETKQVVKSNENSKSSNSNLMLTILLSLVGGISTLTLLTKLFSHKKSKNIHKNSASMQNSNKVNLSAYDEISQDKNLNWREKYKKYNEINNQKSSSVKDLAYITNSSATKKIIINQGTKPAYKVNTIRTNDNVPSLNSSAKNETMLTKSAFKASSKNKEVIKEELRAKISQMEHSFKQTPKLNIPSDNKKDIYSDSDSMSEKLSNIKLKSFANPSLGSTHRMLLGAERVPVETAKESRFVKLKNSALNISTRKSASSKINNSDYYKNHGEMNMDKKDNYAVSSLNEYFSILDSEEKATNYFTKPAPVVDGKVSNPISSSRRAPAIGSLNGMIVRSSYSIDSNRGFYIVDMDGASALIGKINDNVFILKKFNEIIEKNLQVRLDSGSVYMVKAGRYKCLVEVAKDRMGTLVEI